MTAAESYAYGLKTWQRRRLVAQRDFLRRIRDDHQADRFADPERGLTYYERLNLRQGLFGRNR